MEARNIGILASMSWNSNNWAAPSTDNDKAHSNYGYVKENDWTHEDLNFGHELYPAEDNGYFIAYTPMFNALPSREASKYVDVVFFRSHNPFEKLNLLVGMYTYPVIGEADRNAEHELYEDYGWGNVRAKPSGISLFENPLVISDPVCAKRGYLPKGKKLGQQGFNYLERANVLKILDDAQALNPSDAVIKKLKFNILTNKKSR